MRTSQLLLATQRESPADAEIISHQLMLRAGMVRKLASGLYTWLPLGLKVLRKIEAIVRDEMNKSGAQEILMPVVQPAELWEASGRWSEYGAELLRISDRHERPFCLGPTHEEVVTDLIRNELQSYKQLPTNLYQIQTKFRDEIRPRFGVMRSREFIMKDAYSFHLSGDCLQNTYDLMYQTYQTIFSRLDLDFRAVQADTGSIGGNASHEFHVLAASGEDEIAFCAESDYAANVELAEALAPDTVSAPAQQDLEKVATPSVKTIEQVAEHLNLQRNQIVKTILVKADPTHQSEGLVALVLRGDHILNEIKAEKLDPVLAPLTFANEQEIEQCIGCNSGSIGPANLSIPVIVDRSAAVLADFAAGANENGFHYTGMNWQRDAQFSEVADLRSVATGDPSPDGLGSLDIRRGIEVGHIFQLGTKYSQALGASVLDENGKAKTLFMGCYGIGISRVMAAAIEQNHDENGIVWPSAIAPFEVVLIAVNIEKSAMVKERAELLYNELLDAGIDVLLDDRNERPGVKFAEMELIGIPHRVVIGEKSLQRGVLEYRERKSQKSVDIAVDSACTELCSLVSHQS